MPTQTPSPDTPEVSKWTSATSAPGCSPIASTSTSTTLAPTKKFTKVVAVVAGLVALGAIVGSSSRSLLGHSTGISSGVGGINGVCYDSYLAIGNVASHFSKIKSKFGAVRTYQSSVENKVNLIDAASAADLKIAAGIWTRGPIAFSEDLNAAVEGTKRHAGNVMVVYVGNEDFHNQKSVEEVKSWIAQTRSAFQAAGLNTPIGSVQTDADWLNDSMGGQIAGDCDVIGVNIYPYFGNGAARANPIESLTRRFNAVVAKYPGKDVRLTETGWPSEGGPPEANFDAAQKYFRQYQEWATTNGGYSPFYFQFHDVSIKGGAEAHFGIALSNGQSWKYDVAPAASSNANDPPAPAPSTSTPVPTTTNAIIAHNASTEPSVVQTSTSPPVTTLLPRSTLPLYEANTASGTVSETNVTAIVLGSMGSLLVVAAAIAVFVYRTRRKMRQDKESDLFLYTIQV
jgi:glucan endo-1,3-beta-D-glucosidase